ncbi:MAG TPA: ABC-2 family transporter protein [Pirellulales bacterium]|jgi:ABC-2 type transport system permease protein|nr:ABC-2 family transporter protein [Pirellulales bacterium]
MTILTSTNGRSTDGELAAAALPTNLRAHPAYSRVFLTFARNSLIRDMTFRSNFIIECVSSLSWMAMNLGYYLLIFQFTTSIGENTGWGKYEFFAFLATTLFVNSIVQAFFMPNCEEFSELIRTGGLDFALLKPIDTQFLISLHKIDWSSLSNFLFAVGLLAFSVAHLPQWPTPWQMALYPLYVVCGVAIMYSLMITLSSTSVWLGRNQTLYDFWFYITNFSRYPMEIYRGTVGGPLRWFFTFIIPVLVVVNVPAQLIAKPLAAQSWPLAAFAVLAAAGSLWLSRVIFTSAMRSYRSASS